MASAPTASAAGTIIRNAQRQPNASTTIPETAGANRLGSTHPAESTANIVARHSSGKARLTSTYPMGAKAPVPAPWRVRPTTIQTIDGAAAATTRPTTNMAIDHAYGTTAPRRSASSPAATVATRLASV